MKTLIRDASVITLDDQDRILASADVAVQDGTILGVESVPESFVADEVIDAAEHVLLPGLFNAHAHIAMTLERGWAEDLPFDRWLNEKVWVAESALEEEDVYWGAALACCEMIRAGVVGFADHYFWMNQVAKAAQESGMKANLAWCLFGGEAVPEVGGVTLSDIKRFVADWHGAADGRIRCSMGPHSPYMCSGAFLQASAGAAREAGVGVHLHVSESQAQVDNSLAAHGKTPVVYLADLGVFDLQATAAHCIAATDADIEVLAAKGVNVAHAPKTYMKLAMGMAPLPKMLRAGVNVALASDGPASNSDINLLETLRLTGLVHKNALGKPEALPTTKLLRLATQAGVRALGFDAGGMIAAGQPADLILLDTRAPHWFPRHDLAAGVVYTSHPGDVSHVMVGGRWLLRDGELLTLDEERIRHEAERRAFRMVGTEVGRMRDYAA